MTAEDRDAMERAERQRGLAERHLAEREALTARHATEVVEFEIQNAHIPNALPDPD